MQFYLRSFYNILRQQNNFEWTTEHQKLFVEEKKLFSLKNYQTPPDPDQPFYVMCAPQVLALAQLFYNITMEETKCTSFAQTLDNSLKLNLDSLL